MGNSSFVLLQGTMREEMKQRVIERERERERASDFVFQMGWMIGTDLHL
jgi:hypothetical protein